jgi:hypothetical protein
MLRAKTNRGRTHRFDNEMPPLAVPRSHDVEKRRAVSGQHESLLETANFGFGLRLLQVAQHRIGQTGPEDFT